MDIENLVNNLVKNHADEKKIIEFTRELACENYSDRKAYDKHFTQLRKKYKICPKKMLIRNAIKYIDKDKVTSDFMKFSLRKIGKSSSGVAVITVLTSPFPKYTNVNGEIVEQSFSCGKNCAYCPNEPEMKLDLTVVSIQGINKEFVRVYCEMDLNYIRIINYILYHDVKIIVEDSIHFTDHEFTIKISNNTFEIGETFIGVKIAQPRSYISSEPAVLRANRNQFDCKEQIVDRANVLNAMGHPIDKIEIIILGGTWDHYPLDYRIQFIRDMYYTVNTYNGPYHEPQSLEKEIEYNQRASSRIIGVTTETRPDCITIREIKNLRKMNITRVQIGVQHFDDDVLKYIKRDCYLKDTVKATYLLKQNGYKIDMHLMPDLPGSTFEKDMNMFKKLFSHKVQKVSEHYYKYTLDYPDIQPDQLKIYPCSTVPFTEIKEWYDNGTYKPYSENKDKLIEVVLYIKLNVFPWIRLNRIIRDIPMNWIEGGNKDVNLRQHLLNHMKKNNMKCNCIRCREVNSQITNIDEAVEVTREYNGNNGKEYFISYESPDYSIIYGFIRLRINNSNDDLFHKNLNDSAFIRELHVYGSLCKHNEKGSNVQHQGFGTKLLKSAEDIVKLNNIEKINIIAGVGVRQYYEKFGYNLNSKTNYMEKELDYLYTNNKYIEFTIIIIINLIMISLVFDYYYYNMTTIFEL